MATVWAERIGPRELRVYGRFQETLEAFPTRERLRLTVDRDRNGRFNALFHLMLSLVAKAVNAGPAKTDIDTLKKWVKLRRGWYDVIPLPQPRDGITHVIEYKSTAFAKMGEGEFHQFATETCETIRDELAPWISQAPEWGEIMAIVNSIAPEDAA